MIGKILELLMTIMEVKKYEVKKIETKGKKYEPTPFGVDEYEYDKYYTLITQPKLYEYNIFIDGMKKESANAVILAVSEYAYKKNTTLCSFFEDIKTALS